MAEIARVDETGKVEETAEAFIDEELVDQGEKLGVAFGCIDGRCGSCRAEVVEGMDLLNDRTQEELDMGLDEGESYRLLCQCKFKKDGLVKIRV